MRLTIYGKPECHLCDEMKEIVARVVAGRTGASLAEVDISGDAALVERYGLEIPVLVIDGVKVAKYRVTEPDLRRMLAARERSPGQGPKAPP